jgi:[NiFe] hydrogenase assembly HybE family chaperone
MSLAFESSSAGPLPDEATLECGVCWWVYDPAEGDDIRHIAPGTPFTALPDDWRCPCCDAAKSKFMSLEAGASNKPSVALPMDVRIESLLQAYAAAEANIVGLPIHNDRLSIEAVGFRPHAEGFVGVIVSPWSMNLTFMPADPAAPLPGPVGGSRQHVFPSGGYSFIIGLMDGVGTVETCSLFSPMDEFDDPAVAKAAAEAAMEGLFEAPEPEPEPEKPDMGRRFLLTMNGKPR